MANSQRVPIVDKNGKASTVYRNVTLRNNTIAAIAEELLSTLGIEDEDEETLVDATKQMSESLSRYTDGALQRVQEYFDDYSSGFRYHGDKHHTIASMIEEGASELLISNLMAHLPAINKNSIIAYAYYRENGLISWELESSRRPLLRVLGATADAIEKTLYAKSRFWIVDSTTNWCIPVIEDKQLVQLVIDRVEDNERINDIIKERKSVDCNIIVDSLDNPAYSLSNGVI